MPVAIHISDPSAFFMPTDRFNERFEELNNHPDWSFYDHDFPSNLELLAARNRMIAKHPNTQFRCICMWVTLRRILRTSRRRWIASRICSSISRRA